MKGGSCAPMTGALSQIQTYNSQGRKAQIERTHSRVHCPQSLFRSVFHRETYEDK